MSAIAGVWHFDGRPEAGADGEAMMAAMRQYAADDARSWGADDVFLGCRARWITPESVNERLPLWDAERELAITADAIVDNRRELFERLQVPNERRGGMTDSELILLAYRRWGKDAPEYMVGDFAFVIWDRRKRELFGARDLLGHRTLYYCLGAGRFAFCTAIAPLLALPGVPKQLHEPWLAEFMAIPEMFECTDIGATPYRGIRQLPPAHTMTVADGRVTLAGYGSLEPRETLRLGSDGEYVEAFRDVFGEAVKARLRVRGEVAATLSGGLDSGSVASFAARALREEGKRLHAYSYVPPGDFTDWTSAGTVADESRFIRATVDHVGNISERFMDFPGVNPLSEADEWLDILEAPYKFFENGYWLKGMHEQAASQGACVLLTGARGNFTISWGPALYYYAQLFRRLRWLSLLRELKLYSVGRGVRRSRLLSVIGRQALPLPGLRPARGGGAGPDIPTMLIDPDFARRTDVFARLRDKGIGVHGSMIDDPLELRKDKLRSLPVGNKNGATATKLSLRYGVWERDPTSDPRVVRFCFSVPLEQYVHGGMDRALIRRATEHYLPDEVRLNQRVRGIQGADWLHRVLPSWEPLAAELRQLCADSAAAGYLNVGRIREALAEFGERPRPEHAFRPEMRMLMRSLIIYRFIKRF